MNTLLESGLPLARGASPMLTGPEIPLKGNLPGCPFEAYKDRYSSGEIAKYKYLAATTAEIDLSSALSGAVDTWSELADLVSDVAYRGIEGRMGVTPHDLPSVHMGNANDRLHDDCIAGAHQIAAFLEVVPRVLYMTDFTDPNAELALRARRSKYVMVTWSKLDDATDSCLVYGLAYPKPSRYTDDKVENYQGLRFHTKWFQETETGAIDLRPEKLPHVRGVKDAKLDLYWRQHTKASIASGKVVQDAVLGCPALDLIPKMYDVMVTRAEADGMFEATYRTERQEHGFIPNQLAA